MSNYLHQIIDGLSGKVGTVGLYSALQRCFITFGVLSPVCFFIDAPFGRFTSSRFTVNGSIGWLLMEIVSPIAFLVSLPLSYSSTFPSLSPLNSRYCSPLFDLPTSRKCLIALFIVHYLNRSIVSTLQNPHRAKMNVLVPVSAVVFNLMNGSLMGMSIGGGATNSSNRAGVRDGMVAKGLFGVGIALWTVGFVSNIYHDQILYRIKRQKMDEGKAKKEKAVKEGKKKESTSKKGVDPRERYSIPTGGLYRYVSHPSYSSEWLEWFGYLLCYLSLSPSPFPPISTTTLFGKTSSISTSSPLLPLTKWYLTPPALFLWQEIGVMLPRARSGHRWYERTFGKEWKEKGPKWVVVPGIY